MCLGELLTSLAQPLTPTGFAMGQLPMLLFICHHTQRTHFALRPNHAIFNLLNIHIVGLIASKLKFASRGFSKMMSIIIRMLMEFGMQAIRKVQLRLFLSFNSEKSTII